MKTLKLELGERSYPIYIGRSLLGDVSLLAPHLGGMRVALVSNTTVAPLYLSKLRLSLASYKPVEVVLP